MRGNPASSGYDACIMIRRWADLASASRRHRRIASLLAAVALLSGCGDRTPKVDVSTATTSPPSVVAFDPQNGAIDVDPSRTTLSVTFDREMDPDGWAWVIENPTTAPDLGEAHFDAGDRTNTVAVKLQPGRDYVIWINSTQYSHFRDRAGTAATPVRWTFSTRAEDASSREVASPSSSVPAGWPIQPLPAHGEGPHVVTLDPPNGATAVDPAKSPLRVTFDRTMEGSWAWVTEGKNFPAMAGNAYYEPDGRTAALPVKLEAGHTYVLWLNSPQYTLFRDVAGHPLQPLRWTFTTASKR